MKEIRVRVTVDIHLTVADESIEIHDILNEMEYEFLPASAHKDVVSIPNTDMWDYSILNEKTV